MRTVKMSPYIHTQPIRIETQAALNLKSVPFPLPHVAITWLPAWRWGRKVGVLQGRILYPKGG